jgi:hypothetical protein
MRRSLVLVGRAVPTPIVPSAVSPDAAKTPIRGVALRSSHASAASLTSAIIFAFAIAGCSSDAASTDSPAPRPGNASEATATSSQHPATPRRVQHLVIAVRPVDTMPTTWREVFVVPYGSGNEQLGTSRGGEAGAPRHYGPESGAPAPDGSWWFLDTAKRRLAHYDAAGHFVGAVKVPARLLVDGRYFQWALPHVLADGTLVAFRLTSGAAAMLRLRDGVLDEVPLTAMFTPTYDDGTLLYGTVAGGPALATVDPESGDLEPARAYRLPSGAAFTIGDDFDRGVIRVDTPSGSLRLSTVAPSGAIAHMGVQMRAGADDSLHLYLMGASNERHAAQLVGYVRIDPSGAAAKLEPLPSPNSNADRGSPAQLVLAPGESTPMLVYVMPDGVHIYERTT